MSIRLMSIAWKAPDLNPGQKLVLIALCDNASDEGICYPSIRTLAIKCSMGERTVTRHISDFETLGLVTREERPGRSTFYTINPRQFGTPSSTPPADLAPPPANLAPTPNNEEPSPNGQQPKAPRKPRAKREPLPMVALKTWLENVKAKGEMALPADHSVFTYAESVSLPPEYVELAWKAFKSRYTNEQKNKRYADWRLVFLKAVKQNWLKLWWWDAKTGYALTTAGAQSQLEHREKPEAEAAE